MNQENNQAEKRLQLAFAAGAITDGLAIIPMLCPYMAKLLWGFDSFSGQYFFAMGYAASLMLGWTVLLIWAYNNPIERRFVALLTLVVIAGLFLTEIAIILAGAIDLINIIPTFAIQIVLTYLFLTGYLYSAPKNPK
ncbi:MAG: hypothetical protein H8E14_16400 [Candidatus Marinimicrobia bacterium]|nr:hypothetical protein [Candidatus Neomarinimicrobiota bacterium]